MDFQKKTLWREKANKLELAASRFRALSGPAKHRDHLQDNLSVESCFRRKVLVPETSGIPDSLGSLAAGAYYIPRAHAAQNACAGVSFSADTFTTLGAHAQRGLL